MFPLQTSRLPARKLYLLVRLQRQYVIVPWNNALHEANFDEQKKRKDFEQAGAELCQAQEKLRLAKGTLPEVVFNLF